MAGVPNRVKRHNQFGGGEVPKGERRTQANSHAEGVRIISRQFSPAPADAVFPHHLRIEETVARVYQPIPSVLRLLSS
jgi:hypothetical protein